MNEKLAERILSVLYHAGRNGMRFADLMQRCRVTRTAQGEFRTCLKTLEQQNDITDTRFMLYHNKAAGICEATVTRLSRTLALSAVKKMTSRFSFPENFSWGQW